MCTFDFYLEEYFIICVSRKNLTFHRLWNVLMFKESKCNFNFCLYFYGFFIDNLGNILACFTHK